jgi:hypothetical protein
MIKLFRPMFGLAAVATLLFAQGNTGSIVGTVTDSSGAAIPSVEVTIVNTATGVSTPAKSDNFGSFSVRYLIPGTYQLKASAAGFRQFLREDISLDPGRELRVDFPMTTGIVSESVTVTGTPPLLETETGALGAAMGTKLIGTLPSYRRNVMDYTGLMPGMVTAGENPQANGGQGGKDPVFLDGAYASLTVNTGTSTRPNPDVVSDIQVLINSFSAEYGDTSGSVTVLTTKSGTNEYRGDLFYFFQNDKLNAGNYFTHVVPLIKYNEFGGVIGGPIKKNKTFIFFGYRQFRNFGTAQWTNLSVPDAAFRKGDFSEVLATVSQGTDALGRPVYANEIFDPKSSRTVTNSAGQQVVVRDPFPGNMVIPASRISPAALKLQALYPAAQISTPYNNYNSNGPNVAIETQYDGRLDHNFSDSDKLMLKYSYRLQDNRPAPPFPGNPLAGGSNSGGTANWKRPDHTITLNYVKIISPTITNDLHLNWFQVFAKRLPAGFNDVGYSTYGIQGMPGDNQTQGVPRINITNINALGAAGGTLWEELQGAKSLVNQTSIVRGRHTIKFGGEIRSIRTDNYQPNPNSGAFNFANTFTDQRGFGGSGYAYASFLLGLPTSFNYTIYPDYFRSRASVFAAYVQDDFRVNRKLTVNFGLRWDTPTQFHELHNRSGIFDLNTGVYKQFGVNGFRTTTWPNDWNNLGPRAGFAYSPFNDSKTVVRGGFGMFTIGTQLSGATGNMPNTPIFADTDTGRYTTIDNVTWPATLDNIAYAPADKTGKGSLSVGVWPDYNPMSYKLQWNLSVSHDFHGYLVEAGYVGDHGVHLSNGGYNENAIPLALAAVAQGRKIAPFIPYPQYPNGVQVNAWIGSSHLEELVSKVEKRYSKGFSMLGAFTWQKPMAVTGGYRDPVGNRNLESGISGLGNKFRFTDAWTYELPMGKGRHWSSKSLLAIPFSDWEVNGILTMLSGAWLTPGLNFDSAQIGQSSYPNVVIGQDPNLPRSQRTLDHWFNTNAFAAPATYTAGNAGHSLFLGPGVANLDLGIGRRFNCFGSERRQLEFRGEIYNAPNRPIFGNPNTTVANANYGRITSASGQRNMQLGLKFYF